MKQVNGCKDGDSKLTTTKKKKPNKNKNNTVLTV
jgi:hypothetical protein